MKRLGLLSDPHGNVDALRHAIQCARSLEVDSVWCLGDLIGDPNPNETIEFALHACDLVIAGNHDLLAARRLDEAYISTHGERMTSLREELAETNAQVLEKLPIQQIHGKIIATHACIDHPTARIADSYEAEVQLSLCDEDYLVVGHSHTPFAYDDRGSAWIPDPLVRGRIEFEGRAIICPGSVCAIPNAPATICILDLETHVCSWHAI